MLELCTQILLTDDFREAECHLLIFEWNPSGFSDRDKHLKAFSAHAFFTTFLTSCAAFLTFLLTRLQWPLRPPVFMFSRPLLAGLIPASVVFPPAFPHCHLLPYRHGSGLAASVLVTLILANQFLSPSLVLFQGICALFLCDGPVC